MATLGTPFKRYHVDNFNIFEILDDSSDGTASKASTDIAATPQPQRHTVLSEVPLNKVHGVSHSSPDDLALQLETFHIQTPAKINKTRGLKPRPTVDSSTFCLPTQGQKNTKIFDGVGAASSEAARVTPGQPDDGQNENFLARRLDGDPVPDQTQLAKHQAGQFEYVLSLPALATESKDSTVNGPNRFLKDKEEVTTIQFGCNLLYGEGKSDLVRRNRADSAHSYTLIVTPIEGGEQTSTTTVPSVTEKVKNMATSLVTEVPALSAPLQRADETEENGEEEQKHGLQSSAAAEVPSKSVAVAEVAEIPASPRQSDKPENNGDQRMPAYITGLACDSPSQTGHNFERSDRSRSRRTSENTRRGEEDDIIDEIIFQAPAPSPSSRIEDSVEALDELEEQLEAINEVAQLDHVLPPATVKQAVTSNKPTAASSASKRTQPSTEKQATQPITGTVRGKPSDRRASVRHSMAAPSSKDSEQPAAKAIATKRLSVVSRPASLAPPKPLVRSAKPPTVSTFELPGEEVARRLKEKRQARLSMSMPPPSQTPSKPKTATSTRPPTKPNFELPGEAISRRKREEREAKLKAEQEEERKRREFKARPVRMSVVAGATFPRQTAASRARMSLKAAMAADTPAATPTAANKRHSIIGPASAGRPSLAVSTTPSLSRGRGSVALSPSTAHVSRAASSSTGSARGSSISAGEMQQQKQRGKDIFKRESGFATEREQQRRSREEAARKAREEAAERSRQLSREWAQKQKAKKVASAGGVGAGGVPSFAA